MANEVELRILDLSGGQNSNYANNALTDNELIYVQNVVPGDIGELINRDGHGAALAASNLSAQVRGLHRAVSADGATIKTIAGAGANLYHLTSGDFVSGLGSLSTGERWEFIPWLDAVACINGADVPINYTISTNAFAVLGGLPPIASTGAVWLDRMFLNDIANPSRVWYSGVGNNASWGISDFIERFRSDDADEIVKIWAQDTRLIVFKRNSIWQVVGSTVDDWDVNPLENKVGCSAPHSVAEIEGIIFFLHTTGIYAIAGTEVLSLSDKIEDWIENINASQIALASAYGDFSRYEISVPTGTSTVNNEAMMFDIRHGSVDPEGRIKGSWWPGQTLPFVMAVIYEREAREIVFAHTTVNNIYQRTGNDDNGAAFTKTVRTKHFHFEAPHRQKQLRRVYHEENTSQTNLTLGYNTSIGGGYTSLTFDSYTDRGNPSDAAYGRYIGFQFQQATTAAFRISGLTAVARHKGLR